MRKGFTLIEVLLVLVILSTMVAVTLPYATRSHDSLRLEQEVRNLADAVRYATQLAENTNRPIRVLLDTTRGCYCLQTTTLDAQEYVSIEDPIGVLRYLDPKVRIVNVEGFESDERDQHYLSLDPRKPWPEAALDLSAGDWRRKVKVTGRRVEVEDAAK